MKTSAKNPKRSSGSVSKVRKNSQLSVCSDDQGFETDLEDDLEKLHIEKERKKFIKTTAERYFEACESLNAVPVAKFLRQCQTGSVDLKHYGCGWPPVVHTTRGVANNQHERPKRSLFTGPRYNTFFLLLSSWILSPEDNNLT